jgi:hypothetical protein
MANKYIRGDLTMDRIEELLCKINHSCNNHPNLCKDAELASIVVLSRLALIAIDDIKWKSDRSIN